MVVMAAALQDLLQLRFHTLVFVWKIYNNFTYSLPVTEIRHSDNSDVMFFAYNKSAAFEPF